MKPDPETYMNDLPDRLLEAAHEHQTVHIKLDKKYLPLFTSDIIRGQTKRLGTMPEEGLHTHLMSQSDTPEPTISLSVPSQIAQIIAMDLKMGKTVRDTHH